METQVKIRSLSRLAWYSGLLFRFVIYVLLYNRLILVLELNLVKCSGIEKRRVLEVG